MGAPRTSEDAGVVAGEGKQGAGHEDRAVDAEAKIIIDAGPLPPTPRPARPLPQPAIPRAAAQRSGGLGLVIVVYILASAALAAAIYERYFM